MGEREDHNPEKTMPRRAVMAEVSPDTDTIIKFGECGLFLLGISKTLH